MEDLDLGAFYQELVDIYLRSAEPGWEKMKTFLDIGEQGGLWSHGISYVYYPNQEPETFSTTWFDQEGKLLEKTANTLMLELWEHDKATGRTWYAATFTVYPDGRFAFEPSSQPEKSAEEILAVEHIP